MTAIINLVRSRVVAGLFLLPHASSVAAAASSLEQENAISPIGTIDFRDYEPSYNQQFHRGLTLQKVAGFLPKTNISDHASIDLDQQLMEKYLDEHTDEGFDVAWEVYEHGCFSRSYALLTLQKPLPKDVPQGTKVYGYTLENKKTYGTVRRLMRAESKKLDVLYYMDDDEDPSTGCYVGANPNPITNECFTDKGGAVTIEGIDGVFVYQYNLTKDNLAERTIRSMSTNAQHKQRPCGVCGYYKEFQKFAEYYGKPQFAHTFIEAAFEGKKVDYKSGSWDFTQYDREARAEAIRTATVNLITQSVLRDMETAFMKCLNKELACTPPGCPADLHLMEGAAAFYAGSLEGNDGHGQGLLQYDLADKMCKDFKTCGEKGDLEKGTSYVNIEALKEFNFAQEAIYTKKCADERRAKDRMSQLIDIPIIQAVLKYAYINANQPGASLVDEAIGAAYAFFIIPKVAKCNQQDARLIYDNMKPNRGFQTDFEVVKLAFERNYMCLRVTCEDIGGYYHHGSLLTTGSYYEGAEPCVSEGYEPEKMSPVMIAIITISAIFATFCACCCWLFWRLPRKSRRRRAKEAAGEVEVTPSTGELA